MRSRLSIRREASCYRGPLSRQEAEAAGGDDRFQARAGSELARRAAQVALHRLDTDAELDRRVGEAIDIYVNNRLVARGEVVLVEDKLGVTMTEIIKAERT